MSWADWIIFIPFKPVLFLKKSIVHFRARSISTVNRVVTSTTCASFCFNAEFSPWEKNKIETSLFLFLFRFWGSMWTGEKITAGIPPPKKDDTLKEEKSVCPRFDSVTVDAFCEERNDKEEKIKGQAFNNNRPMSIYRAAETSSAQPIYRRKKLKSNSFFSCTYIISLKLRSITSPSSSRKDGKKKKKKKGLSYIKPSGSISKDRPRTRGAGTHKRKRTNDETTDKEKKKRGGGM